MAFNIDTTLIDEAKEMIRKAQLELRDKVEASLGKTFTELFEAYPKLESFQWRQYTPYFNDGDECIFGYHGCSVRVERDFVPETLRSDHDNRKILELESYEFSSYNMAPEKNIPDYWRDFGSVVNSINEFLSSSEEYLEMIWGNHVEVIVKRSGFHVREYNHD